MSRSTLIQIFYPDSDPEGVRIAELENNIAQIFVIPRDKLLNFANTRDELLKPCLYFLFDDERTKVYIGECENFVERVADHLKRKSFWQWALICTSSRGSLNKAEVKYLESISWKLANESARFEVLNINSPSQSSLHEFAEGKTLNFFEDIKMLMSSLGFNVFEKLEPQISDNDYDSTSANISEINSSLKNSSNLERDYDTIVAPCKASSNAYQEVFVEESCWYAIRIAKSSINKFKYIALYESSPVKAIKSYAKITKIEPYPKAPSKYIIHHEGDIISFNKPIVLGSNPNLSLQGARYFLLEDMKASKDLAELTNMTFGSSY